MIEVGKIYYILGATPVRVLKVNGERVQVEYLKQVIRGWVGEIRRTIEVGEIMWRSTRSLRQSQTRGL